MTSRPITKLKKAMILAAGRGKRMMPLTANTPKPLLKVAGKPLMQYHIDKLSKAGINELVINHSYLGSQIEAFFGNGKDFGVNISWSREDTPLETAGGIIKALPMLGDEPFLLINGDVWCDFPIEKLVNAPHLESLAPSQKLAHLILVQNPAHNPKGDFALDDGLINNQGADQWTFSGISVLHPALFRDSEVCPALSNKSVNLKGENQVIPLATLLRQAAALGRVSGELFVGDWQDIGTPDRLANLQKLFEQ